MPTDPHFSPPTVLPTRRLRVVAWFARLALGLVVALWLLFGAALGVLHGWIVPRIGEFRPQLEARASKALGVAVKIGQITAQSPGLLPSFELADVVLLDPQARPALRLPRVVASLSALSLGRLGFEQLLIEGPELDIRRTTDGRIQVAGLDLARSQGDGGNASVDWLFSQSELVLRGGTVRWTDELRAAPPLALTELNAVIRNPGKRHLMRLDATPPPEWGDRFSLRAMFRQPFLVTDGGNWKHWTGQVYGDFSRVDASALKQYVSLEGLGMDVVSGRGSLRAWVDVSGGRPTGGAADVALQDVNARWGEALEPLVFESVSGRFGGSQLATGFTFQTQGLTFTTDDGLSWPGGNVSLTHTDAHVRKPAQTELKADRLDLAALALIARRLPLDKQTHAVVRSFDPKGLVEALDARWQGSLAEPETLAARGRVTGLELAAQPAPSTPSTPSNPELPSPGRPGVTGASIDFNLTHEGGQAKVAIAGGSMDFPGVFAQSRVPFDALSTDLSWKHAGPRLEVQLRNLQFDNADAQGQAQVTWRTAEPPAAPAARGGANRALPASTAVDARFPGVLDLQGRLSRGDAAQVHRYLPLVLPESVRAYVHSAVTQGDLSDVRFKIKGNLHDLPFSQPRQGDFLISAKFKNGQYAYVPAPSDIASGARTSVNAGTSASTNTKVWPALTLMEGSIAFDRRSMELSNVKSRVLGLNGLVLTKGSARIADFMNKATVEVSADIKGPLTDALGFVNNSPVSTLTGGALSTATGTGAADYTVRLGLPLASLEKSTVRGSVTLAGNDVQFTPDAPLLQRLKGALAFTETGFKVSNAQARLLGGDVRFDGGSRPVTARPAAASGVAPGEPAEAEVSFQAQGSVSAEGLQQARELGAMSQLARHASGSAAYTATLGFRRGHLELLASSNLQGMALNLPAPLSKPADAALPLRFESALVRDSIGAGKKLQDQVSLSLGRLVTVQYLRDISGAQPQVLRGSMGLGLEPGESAPLVSNQVAANVRLDAVDLDAWGKVFNGAAPQPASSAAGTSTASNSAAQAYLPTALALRAGSLKVQGYQLHNLLIGGSREGLNWRANIDADELNGYVEYRQAGNSAGSLGPAGGRVYARLSRLNLGAGTAREVEAILDEQPASIPALDIVVDDLQLRGRRLGRIEIDAVNRTGLTAASGLSPAVSSIREWRLNKLNLSMPEASFSATGNWAAVGGPSRQAVSTLDRRRTAMNFKLDIADAGELLKRLGMEGVIRRGAGRLEGQVGWAGSPMSLDYPSLNGQFNMNVEAGQFLKAEPGIAKLLGVLSLQSLPRRLTLDFRDVFSDGFAFDSIRGDVAIIQGRASTNNLQMRGVNAAVFMDGSADIARETQDLKVVVVPDVNAGTASLLASVINPAVGLGTFLAQLFLRGALSEAATQEFHIDGSWTEPRITRVDRKAQPSPSPRKP